MSAVKGDLINGAYSQLRISGITVNPSTSDLALALRRLEGMAAEFAGRNICVGYNFQDTPDVNDLHNIEQKYWEAFETNLAVRLMPDFGKQPTPALIGMQSGGLSFLVSSTAPMPTSNYPSRQPIGSGNSRRGNRYRRFYPATGPAPTDCETSHQMAIGGVDIFTEHFDAYLRSGETVASYTIEADTGLTISAASLTTPDITYTVTATGNATNSNAFLQVRIVATTSDGRIETRLLNFELIDTELS